MLSRLVYPLMAKPFRRINKPLRSFIGASPGGTQKSFKAKGFQGESSLLQVPSLQVRD